MTFFAHVRPHRLAHLLLACPLTAVACTSPEAEDSTSSNDESTSAVDSTETDDGDEPQIICEPGQTRCADTNTLETCTATGLAWEPSTCNQDIGEECDPCFGDDNSCAAVCVGPCERVIDQPSSEGCSFYTTSIYQALQPNEDYTDAIIVGNPDKTLTAEVTLHFAPYGSNIEEVVETVNLAPGDSHIFELPAELTEYYLETSVFRSGQVHHVTSNVPIVAYLHSPYKASSTNGSSMLLPEHVLTGNYVVYGHKPFSRPNYFVVIALEDQTTVRWWPTFETAGDSLPLSFVEAGEEGSQLLNRLDNIRILTSQLNAPPRCDEDLSGTVIEADKPIWVLSATRGARIPFCHTEAVPGCDMESIKQECHAGSDLLQEQNLPLEVWGREYIGPASPVRGNEKHVWRVFAGEDDVTITVDPPQSGTPIQLSKRGDWKELVVPTGTNLRFSSDKVFMPVQYVTGDHDDANGIGSPAMVQMVPTAQFLDNYVFVTGIGYDPHNYVQFTREAGGADIVVDGAVPTLSWTSVGDWEVATLQISEGAHAVESDGYFGIVQYGWNAKPDVNVTAAYGYPGGMKTEIIYIP